MNLVCFEVVVIHILLVNLVMCHHVKIVRFEPPPMVSEPFTWSPRKPEEILFYWLYQGMKKHPDAPKSFDWGIVALNKYYYLNPTKYDKDLKSLIIINLGKKNFTTKRCLFCGRDKANSFEGSLWAFHVMCLRRIPQEWFKTCVSMRRMIKTIETELVLNFKQKMLALEFVQIRALVAIYDGMTNNEDKKRRELYGLNAVCDWTYENEPNHSIYQYRPDDTWLASFKYDEFQKTEPIEIDENDEKEMSQYLEKEKSAT